MNYVKAFTRFECSFYGVENKRGAFTLLCMLKTDQQMMSMLTHTIHKGFDTSEEVQDVGLEYLAL